MAQLTTLAPTGEAETQVSDVIACVAVCLAAVVPMVIIKIFTKAYVLRNMQLEDYSLIISLLALISYCGIMIWLSYFGQGKQLLDFSLEQIRQFAFGVNYLEILYPIIMFCAKFPVLKQQERIFAGTRITKDWLYWTIQIMIYANLLFAISILVSFIAACVPRARLADPGVDGTCINIYAAIMALSGINIVSDWACLILPAVAVSRLNLKYKQKLGVAAIFAVGLLACIASIVRLVYSVALVLTSSSDVVSVIKNVGIWAIVEFSTVILAACSPSIPRFIKFVKSGRTGGSSTTNNFNQIDIQHRVGNSYRLDLFRSKNQVADDMHKMHSPITVTYEYDVHLNPL